MRARDSRASGNPDRQMAAHDANSGSGPDSEVAGLAKSVERYRRSWIAKGRFYTEAEREAWGCALGLRSGLARRKGTAARNKSIREDPRINAELASEHGLTVRQIRRIRNQN